MQLPLGGGPGRDRQDAVGVDRALAVGVGGGEDGGDGGEVGEARDAALVGAGSEGDQHLRLAAQELGHLLVLAVADPAREEADVDGAVRHRLDVVVLGVHHRRPEDDVHRRGHVEDLLVEVEDGDVAAAARGGPVHRQTRLRAHAGTSASSGAWPGGVASACGPGVPAGTATPRPPQASGPSARTSSVIRRSRWPGAGPRPRWPTRAGGEPARSPARRPRGAAAGSGGGPSGSGPGSGTPRASSRRR